MSKQKLKLKQTQMFFCTPETELELRGEMLDQVVREEEPYGKLKQYEHIVLDVQCSSVGLNGRVKIKDLIREHNTDIAFYREYLGQAIASGLVAITEGGSNE